MAAGKTFGAIKAIQFELWENCDNNCTFCYSKLDRVNCTPEQQLQNIKTVSNMLKDPEKIDGYNCVALIGGEFFQGQLADPKVKEAFMDLIKQINQMIVDGLIEEVWLAATLTRENQSDLYEALNYFEDMSKILITTSYDTNGRYHLENGKEIWLNNLKLLKDNYKGITIHTQTIITQAFIDESMNPETNMIMKILQYSLLDFKLPSLYMKYACTLLKEGDKVRQHRDILMNTLHLYPEKFFIERREDFIKFIYKIKRIFGNEKLKALCIPEVRSKSLYLLSRDFVNGDRWDLENNDEMAPCGHMIDSYSYLDSNKCARCDVYNIYQLEG